MLHVHIDWVVVQRRVQEAMATAGRPVQYSFMSPGSASDSDESELSSKTPPPPAEEPATVPELQQVLGRIMSKRLGLRVNDGFVGSSKDDGGGSGATSRRSPSVVMREQAERVAVRRSPHAGDTTSDEELELSVDLRPYHSGKQLMMRHGTGPNITTAAQLALREARFQRTRLLPKVPKGLAGVELASPIVVTTIGRASVTRGADSGFGGGGETHAEIVRRAPKSLVRIQSYRGRTEDEAPTPPQWDGLSRVVDWNSSDGSDSEGSASGNTRSPRGARSPHVVTVGVELSGRPSTRLPFAMPPRPSPRSIPNNRRKTPDMYDPPPPPGSTVVASRCPSRARLPLTLLRFANPRGPQSAKLRAAGGFQHGQPTGHGRRSVAVDCRAECGTGTSHRRG